MKIAIPYENGKVFQHFGHAEQFKIYEIKDGKVVDNFLVSTDGKGHSAVANFLLTQGADVVICGCIGDGAKSALYNLDMILYGGVEGECDSVVEDFLANRLQYNPDVICEHHEDDKCEGGCGEDGCQSDCKCGEGGCSCGCTK